jgi:hypothetical protein
MIHNILSISPLSCQRFLEKATIIINKNIKETNNCQAIMYVNLVYMPITL